MIQLIDYKGKFTIGYDSDIELDYLEYAIGNISDKQFIEELSWRVLAANYYGVPVYLGKNKKILKVIKQWQKQLDM